MCRETTCFVSKRARGFPFHRNAQTGCGTQPASFSMVPGVPSSLGVERLGRESRADVMNEWSNTSVFLICLLSVDRDSITCNEIL